MIPCRRDGGRILLSMKGRQLGHANTLGQTLAFAGALLPALCRDKRMLEQGVAELVALTAGRKLPFWEAFALAALGRLRFMQGRHEEAIEAIDKGIAGYEEQNIVRWRPMFYAWLAQAHAALGAHAEALKAIELARDLIDAYEEGWFEPEVWRISGELRHDLGLCGFEGAKKLLLDAVRLANSREAKLLELRATKSYAKICLGRDHHGEAHAILNRIFNWFTEGQTIPDLVEAKRLLEKLS